MENQKTFKDVFDIVSDICEQELKFNPILFDILSYNDNGDASLLECNLHKDIDFKYDEELLSKIKQGLVEQIPVPDVRLGKMSVKISKLESILDLSELAIWMSENKNEFCSACLYLEKHIAYELDLECIFRTGNIEIVFNFNLVKKLAENNNLIGFSSNSSLHEYSILKAYHHTSILNETFLNENNLNLVESYVKSTDNMQISSADEFYYIIDAYKRYLDDYNK